MLGTVARDHVVKLAQLMIEAVPANVIAWVQDLEQWAPDHAQLLDEFAALLVRVALVQAVPDYAGDELYELGLLQQLAQGIRPGGCAAVPTRPRSSVGATCTWRPTRGPGLK